MTSYFFMFGRGATHLSMINPPMLWKVKVTDCPANPEDSELATDVTYSVPASSPTPRFYNIYDNFTDGSDVVTLTTGHLRDFRPQGCNVLFMDGHVDRRPFADMRIQTPDVNVSVWF